VVAAALISCERRIPGTTVSDLRPVCDLANDSESRCLTKVLSLEDLQSNAGRLFIKKATKRSFGKFVELSRTLGQTFSCSFNRLVNEGVLVNHIQSVRQMHGDIDTQLHSPSIWDNALVLKRIMPFWSFQNSARQLWFHKSSANLRPEGEFIHDGYCVNA
jgi:hypothetical protein